MAVAFVGTPCVKEICATMFKKPGADTDVGFAIAAPTLTCGSTVTALQLLAK